MLLRAVWRGAVPEEEFTTRKMLQVEFNQQTFQNRFIEFQVGNQTVNIRIRGLKP